MDFTRMTEGDRLRYFRKDVLNLIQSDFGSKIGLKPTAVGQMETGARNVTDRTYILLKEKYNLNVDWLKTGRGDITIEPDTFSLNDYAKQKSMSDEELEIIKCYLELDPDIRKAVISHFKEYFSGTAAKERTIDEKLDSYRSELEAELKGEEKSSVLQTESVEKNA